MLNYNIEFNKLKFLLFIDYKHNFFHTFTQLKIIINITFKLIIIKIKKFIISNDPLIRRWYKNIYIISIYIVCSKFTTQKV